MHTFTLKLDESCWIGGSAEVTVHAMVEDRAILMVEERGSVELVNIQPGYCGRFGDNDILVTVDSVDEYDGVTMTAETPSVH